MKSYDQYNLRTASFDEFVAFLFEHEIVAVPVDKEYKVEPWYWHAEVAYEGVRTVQLYTQLFTKPEFLLGRYSADILEQGFWAIQSGNIECAVSEVIWEKNVPFETRATCVKSMYSLYERLFLIDPLGTSSNMWWDSLTYDWYCGNRSRKNRGEDLAMQNVMFDVLKKILGLPSEACQFAALHGLGHLMHPSTPQVVEQFLNEVAKNTSELREYARAAANFEVM